MKEARLRILFRCWSESGCGCKSSLPDSHHVCPMNALVCKECSINVPDTGPLNELPASRGSWRAVGSRSTDWDDTSRTTREASFMQHDSPGEVRRPRLTSTSILRLHSSPTGTLHGSSNGRTDQYQLGSIIESGETLHSFGLCGALKGCIRRIHMEEVENTDCYLLPKMNLTLSSPTTARIQYI